MKQVVMLLSNAFRPDPRVAREAQALTDAGYQVTILCWDRAGEFPPDESVNGYCVKRIQTVRTVYGAGARQVLHTPRFWRAVAARVRELRPDVLHCHDLDTLPAGWWLKKQAHTKLVYDAHEDYSAMMSLYLPGLMVRALSWLERCLLGRVDHVITASTVFADKLRARRDIPVTTIGNYPSLEPYHTVSQADVNQARSELGLSADALVVAYIGGFSRNRELLPLIEAARDLPNIQVLLWGDGHQRATVEDAVAHTPNLRYMGWLPADRVPLYMRVADVIYYCLKPDYPGAIFNAPNTLAQAMAAARPLIANDVGDLGRIVRETGCGILVPAVTPQAIRQAIKDLQNPATRQTLGNAGRAAAETRYNWDAAGRRLQQIYSQLMTEV